MREIDAEVTRRTYYGEKARTYNEDRVNEEKWQLEHAAVTEFLEGAEPGMTVLDLPVGTGRFLKLYQEKGLDCIGLDVSPEMFEQARKKAAKLGYQADIGFGDVHRIGLADRSCEITVCVRLLNLMKEAEMVAAMRELARVTRNLLIITIRTGDEIKRMNRSWTHRTSVFDGVLRETGFTIEAQRIARRPSYRVVKLVR